MQIRRAPVSPPKLPKPAPAPGGNGEELIDTLKRRSTLVNMIDPVGMTLGIVSRPSENFHSATTIAANVWQGNTSKAQAELKVLVDRAVHPKGAFNYMYKGGQVLGAVVDGTVGGLEIAQGISQSNKNLTMMGVADFVGGTASAVVAAGFPGVSLAATVLSAAGKTGLVMAQPHEFSRIQKAKTVFDAAFAVSNSCLRAGIGVVPALALETALGPTELLYMNVDGFRNKVDGAFDWVVGHLPKPSAH